MLTEQQTTNYLKDYLRKQQEVVGMIPLDKVALLIKEVGMRQGNWIKILIMGNGGSACNASHFIVDLNKGAGDKLMKQIHGHCLSDGVGMLTALGNDNGFETIFSSQVCNLGSVEDLLIGVSVSGNSPDCVRAMEMGREIGMRTVAITGQGPNSMLELANIEIEIPDKHYGRVEDAQMTILHMVCYYIMENAKDLR